MGAETGVRARGSAGILVSSFVVLAIFLSLPLRGLCLDPDWVLMDQNEESTFYYDRNGTNQMGNDMVRVITRVVYSERGKEEALQVLKDLPSQDRLHESRYMYEINCQEMEGRPVSAMHFDEKGTILRSTDLGYQTEPQYLPPRSRMGLVADEACR